MFKRLRVKFKKTPELMTVEDTWAFRSDWTETVWNDWAGCWLRIKVDCSEQDGNVVVINDFKTGKFRQDNKNDYLIQLELYALGALVLYGQNIPDVIVKPRLVYTDTAVIYPPEGELQYTMADLPKLKKTWEKRVRPMMNDKTFAPKPNQYCYSCHFRKSNKDAGGGQCQY